MNRLESRLTLDEAPADRDPRELVARAVARKGGLEALSAVRAVRTTTTTAGGATEITIAFPDKLVIRYGDPDAPVRGILFDGSTGTAKIHHGGRARDFPDAQRERFGTALAAEPIALLVSASRPDAELVFAGSGHVDGEPADVVDVRIPDGISARLFIARATDDVIAIEYHAGGGRIVSLDSNFAPVGDLLIAHQTELIDGSTQSVSVVSTVLLNPPLTAETFAID